MFQMETAVVLVLLLLTAAGGAEVSQEVEELQQGAPYEFQYGVEAPQHGTRFGHEERQDGRGNRRGRYWVALPDGRLQTVEYRVEGRGGFSVPIQSDQEECSISLVPTSASSQRVVLIARLKHAATWSATGQPTHFVCLVLVVPQPGEGVSPTASPLSTAHTFATLFSHDRFYVAALRARTACEFGQGIQGDFDPRSTSPMHARRSEPHDTAR